MSDLYYDVDTGRTYTADELDFNRVEFLDDYQPSQPEPWYSDAMESLPPEPEAGWGETLGRVGIPMATNINRAVTGGAQLLGEAAGLDGLTEWAKSQRGLGALVEAENRRQLGIEQGSTKDFVSNTLGGALPLAAAAVLAAPAALTAGGVMAGGKLLLPTMGLQTLGSRYGELRDMEASPTRAGIGAGLSSAASMALSSIPVSRLYNPSSTLGRKALELGIVEPATEALEAGFDMMVDAGAAGVVNPDPRGTLGDAALGGLLAGPVMAGVSHYPLKYKMNKAQRLSQQRTADMVNAFTNEATIDPSGGDGGGGGSVDPTPNRTPLTDTDFFDTLDATLETFPQEAAAPRKARLPEGAVLDIRTQARPDGIVKSKALPDPLIKVEHPWRHRPGRETLADAMLRQYPSTELLNMLAQRNKVESSSMITEPYTKAGTIRKSLTKQEAAIAKEGLPRERQPRERIVFNQEVDNYAKQFEAEAKQRSQKELPEPIIAKKEPVLIDPPVVVGETRAEVTPESPGPEPILTKRLVDAPVYEIETSGIALRPKFMQWKESDRLETGTNREDRIKEPYDPMKADNLILWQPKNPAEYDMPPGQKYILADGHHRFERAMLDNIGYQNAHILKEADGYTPDKIRSYAAELNISRGRGTIYDQARFIQNEKKISGVEGAMERAKNIGARGRKAANIGLYAESDLWNDFILQRVSPEVAEGIAEGAPNNAPIQLEALKKAKAQKLDPDEARNYAMAVASLGEAAFVKPKGDGGAKGDPGQGTIFDTKQLDNGDRWYRKATAIQRELDAHARAVRSALNNPAAAKRMGLPIDDPTAIQHRVDKIAAESARWRKWSAYPDLTAMVHSETDSGDSTAGDNGVMRLARDIINRFVSKQEGALAMPAMQSIRKARSEEGVRDISAALGLKEGKVTTGGRRPIQQFLEGEFKNEFLNSLPIETVKALRARYREVAIYPSTLARKEAQFTEVYKQGRSFEETRDAAAMSILQVQKPYFDLKDTSKVDQAAIALRIATERAGGKLQPTPEMLANMGLNPAEVKAFFALRDGFDAALDVTQEALIEGGQDPERVESFIRQIKTENYVPLGRFGDYYIHAVDAEGNTLHFSLHEGQKAHKKAIRELLKNKELVDRSVNIHAEKMEIPASDGLESLPANLAMRLSELDPALYEQLSQQGPMAGFPKHFAHAEMVPGYSMDLKRSTGEYITNLANYVARKSVTPKLDRAVEAIDKTTDSKLYSYAKKYRDYVLANDGEAARLRKFYGIYYLSLPNLKSPLLNLTQSVVTTLSELQSSGVKGPTGIWRKNWSPAVEALTKRKAFKKKNPQLYQYFDDALRKGTISAQKYRFIAAISRGKNPTSPTARAVEGSMILLQGSEVLNRTHALFCAIEVAQRKGLTGDAVLDYATEFIDRTHWNYGKSDRPVMARGKKAAFFTFRTYEGHLQRFLRDAAGEGRYKTLATAIGAMGAFGGLQAIPFLHAIMRMVEASGEDPRKEFRDLVNDDDLATLMLYGPLAATGVSLSGAMTPFQDMSPDLGKGIGPAIARTVTGIVGDIPQRIDKARWLYNEMDSPYRAVEALMPEGWRHMSVAARAKLAQEGIIPESLHGFRSPTGTSYMDDASTPQLLAKAAAFTLTPLQREYERQHSFDIYRKKTMSNQNINMKIARAIFDDNPEFAAKLMLAKGKEAKSLYSSAIKNNTELREILIRNLEYNESASPETQISEDLTAIRNSLKNFVDKNRRRFEVLPKKARTKEGLSNILNF